MRRYEAENNDSKWAYCWVCKTSEDRGSRRNLSSWSSKSFRKIQRLLVSNKVQIQENSRTTSVQHKIQAPAAVCKRNSTRNVAIVVVLEILCEGVFPADWLGLDGDKSSNSGNNRLPYIKVHCKKTNELYQISARLENHKIWNFRWMIAG